jgi:putative membrane protein
MRWLVLAHVGVPLAPHDVWAAWNIAPVLLMPLTMTVIVYLWGVRTVWRRAGTGHGITYLRCACFLGGVLALLVALVSPLDAVSGVLFSAHMAQHLVLMLVVAPLLVMSDFPLALLWALPRRWARWLGPRLNHSHPLSQAWHRLSSPICAWLLFALALWGWHTPALYEAALKSETLHAVEHLGFLATAMLFWWVLIKPTRPTYLHYGMAIPYLFTTVLHSGLLGALMTFTSQPWYPYYAPLVTPWGLTPLQDQQLAGLIMWLPGGAVFTLLTIGYFAAWFRALEQRSVQLQRGDARGTRPDLK